MKNFPVIKDIGKEPLYFGLSLRSFMIVAIELIISIFIIRGFVLLITFALVVLITYAFLAKMEKDHGNDFISKFMKRYFENFDGTKIGLSELKKTMKNDEKLD
ncbi:PrgI family protein [Chryseobacterium fistulae]|uniref:Uncharacterized protein n=1 Tax=Chryseobacterium fistulae TaxID=2675058 RepID=A0A6N4XX43_9FLAO|nr:PrgI family protein [Chryseobacterium fistulae]CAA7393928.1 hypothetical protein CHRY9393_03577 [Chryseobacterium fistulae]